MIPDKVLEEKLNELRRVAGRGESVVDAVMHRIDPLPAPVRRSRTRRWIMRSSIGIAATLAICAGAWVLLSGHSAEFAFGDVVQAMNEVESFNYVTECKIKTGWTIHTDTKYLRNKGSISHVGNAAGSRSVLILRNTVSHTSCRTSFASSSAGQRRRRTKYRSRPWYFFNSRSKASSSPIWQRTTSTCSINRSFRPLVTV